MNAAVSLKRRSLKAGAWAGASHVLGQAIRLASNLILARLLVPEAFGIMALISSMMMALNLLSDIGTGPVVIQSARGNDRNFLNTAWTLQIVRGLVLWSIALLLAFWMHVVQPLGWFTPGTLFADPRLPPLIAAATFGLVLNGFMSIKWKLAERNLDLKTTAIIDVIGGIGSAVVMVAGAVMTGSVWALVFGSMAGTLLRCVMSHAFLDGPKASLRLESAAVRELIGKGKWVLVSTVLGFAATNVDRLMLGSLTDGTTLGLFSIAVNLATLVSTVPSMMLMKVAYPAISEVVRDRKDDLERVYRRLQHLTDGALGVVSGALFVASHAIIRLLYDSRYVDAGPMLAYLAIGALGARTLVVDLVFTAMGRTSIVAASVVPRVVVLLVGLPIGYSMRGMEGALMAIVASQFAHWPVSLWFRARHGLGSLRNDMMLPLALITGAGVGWLFERLLTTIFRV